MKTILSKEEGNGIWIMESDLSEVGLVWVNKTSKWGAHNINAHMIWTQKHKCTWVERQGSHERNMPFSLCFFLPSQNPTSSLLNFALFFPILSYPFTQYSHIPIYNHAHLMCAINFRTPCVSTSPFALYSTTNTNAILTSCSITQLPSHYWVYTPKTYVMSSNYDDSTDCGLYELIMICFR